MDNLKKGRIKDFSKYFAYFIRQTCSYYDFSVRESERFYHALVLWKMVMLQSEYHITSNRESGNGRLYIMLHPLKEDLPAFVFEFKKFDNEDEESIEDTILSVIE